MLNETNMLKPNRHKAVKGNEHISFHEKLKGLGLVLLLYMRMFFGVLSYIRHFFTSSKKMKEGR